MANRSSGEESSHPPRSKVGARSRNKSKTTSARKPKQPRAEGPESSAASRRPGLSRRKASDSERPRFRQRRSPRFTGRAAILGAVVVLLALTLAYPAQRYLAQQAQIDQLEAAQRAQQARIHKLQAQKERWNDPDYIRAQARKRRQYVEPGEMAYIIKEDKTTAERSQRAAEREAKAVPKSVWYRKFWSEFAKADRPVVREPD